jgi:glutaredoxin
MPVFPGDYTMLSLRTFLFCAALVISLPCGAQTVTYRWVDSTGKTVFSDQPPAPGTQYVEIKSGLGLEGDRQLPYATRQAAEKYPVTLYTTARCTEICANARTLLNGRGIPFSEKLITQQEEFAEIAKEMGSESFVPGLKVGTQKFPGFEAASWNNLLDLAGYPKTAPYGGRQSGAFSQ